MSKKKFVQRTETVKEQKGEEMEEKKEEKKVEETKEPEEGKEEPETEEEKPKKKKKKKKKSKKKKKKGGFITRNAEKLDKALGIGLKAAGVLAGGALLLGTIGCFKKGKEEEAKEQAAASGERYSSSEVTGEF